MNDTVLKVKTIEYDKNKWLYEQSEDKENRYVLGIKGEKTLICFGVNPSTASPEDTDQTISKVYNLAKRNGFDSYIMLNLYPQRATAPGNLDKELNYSILKKNLQHIDKILNKQKKISVLAAWGNTINKKKYLKECLSEIFLVSKKYNCDWLAINLTKDGNPWHPSRASIGDFISFDINDYVKNIK